MLEKMAKNGGARDARDWDEEEYRKRFFSNESFDLERCLEPTFHPSSPNPNNPQTLAVASNDGSLAAYSLPSCIYASHQPVHSRKKIQQELASDFLIAEPLSIIQGHKGPAYDLKFHGNGDESLLLSCGDDGHIRGWKWMDVLNFEVPIARQGSHLTPIFNFANLQHEGHWGALSPITETNAIAINDQEGSIFSAAGDSCAYCWDMETGKTKVIFRRHSDYLHCIVARKSSNQIITGSEDGTARIWDCRSGRCTQVIYPEKSYKLKESLWVSCMALDSSERWLILSAGSEPLLTRFNISGTVLSQIQCAPQSVFSVCLHPYGVTAVGGCGGLVDVRSQFGSHLCAFCCRGVNASP